MKKILLLSALALQAYAGNIYAQSTTKDHSLLWRITGKNLDKPSYLFGTMHIICPNDYVWTDSMKDNLQKSDKVCFEMDMDDPAVLMEAANGFMDKSGKTLKGYFTTTQYKELERYATDSLHTNLDMYQQMKPIAIQSLMITQTTGCPNPMYYEETIMQAAKKENKEILGLEDAKEQIAVLGTLPDDSVVNQIMETVEGRDTEGKKEYEEMVAAYKIQDLPELYSLIKDSKDEATDMNVFLDERNKKWIPRMADKMKHTSVFFAVGAGHLYGPNGVINLLRKAGYTVMPIK